MREARTDEELVESAQEGDLAALEVLLGRHHDRLRSVCAKVVGRGADADDATQHALISIVRSLDKYDGRARFTTWSYRIATNAAIDELRRRKRHEAQSLDDADAPIEVAAPGTVDDATSARIDIEAALGQLAEEFRIPVVLRDLCGLDYREIAEVLDLRPGTVRSRIARGRGKLADLIGPIDMSGNPKLPSDVQEPDDG